MKITLVLVLCIIGLVGFLIFSAQRACSTHDENSVLKGQAIELTKQLDAQKVLLGNSRKANTELQTEMDTAIASLEEAITATAETINTLNGRIRQLRETRVELTDPEPIILNLEEQIETQGEIISNLQFTIAKKDDQIFSLTKKHISERDLRIEVEKAFDMVYNVNVIRMLQIEELEKKLRGTRFMSKVKTGAVIGLAVAVVYGLVKK